MGKTPKEELNDALIRATVECFENLRLQMHPMAPIGLAMRCVYIDWVATALSSGVRTRSGTTG